MTTCDKPACARCYRGPLVFDTCEHAWPDSGCTDFAYISSHIYDALMHEAFVRLDNYLHPRDPVRFMPETMEVLAQSQVGEIIAEIIGNAVDFSDDQDDSVPSDNDVFGRKNECQFCANGLSVDRADHVGKSAGKTRKPPW